MVWWPRRCSLSCLAVDSGPLHGKPRRWVTMSVPLQPDDGRKAQSPPVQFLAQIRRIFLDGVAVGEKMPSAVPLRFAIGLNFHADVFVIAQQAFVAQRK